MRLLLVHAPGPGREAVQDALAQAGYVDVVTTADPARTLELCVTERPDLVLLDFDIPESAHRALDPIRHLTDGADSLQVLALSGQTNADIRRWALANGVRDFVTAPIDITEFLVRVQNALQTRHLQRQFRPYHRQAHRLWLSAGRAGRGTRVHDRGLRRAGPRAAPRWPAL